MSNATVLSALESARLEPPEDDECTCADGEDFCQVHDDPDEAVDWEKLEEDRAERKAERDE